MKFRHQPPVASPLGLGALFRGTLAALGRSTRSDRDRLTTELRSEFGSAAVLLTDSGTTALGLAIRAALHATPGGPVALPAYGCFDLATAADSTESAVLLYDVDPATLGPDWNSLRAALKAGARAVVAVHHYGMPAAMDQLESLAGEQGAILVEDAAQAVGARYRGRAAGAWGSLGVLSFGRGKGLTGSGGGALLVRDAEAVQVVQDLAAQLADGGRGTRALLLGASQWVLARPSLYGIPASLPFLGLGETVYRSPRPGRRIAAASLAMVVRNRRESEAETRRRRNSAALMAAVISHDARVVSPVPGAEPGFLRLPVLSSPSSKVRFATLQGRRLGVMPGYPSTLAELPGFGERVLNRSAGFAGAGMLSRDLFTFPTHGLLGQRDLTMLAGILTGAHVGGSEEK